MSFGFLEEVACMFLGPTNSTQLTIPNYQYQKCALKLVDNEVN
jgi:hypothetical protein